MQCNNRDGITSCCDRSLLLWPSPSAGALGKTGSAFDPVRMRSDLGLRQPIRLSVRRHEVLAHHVEKETVLQFARGNDFAGGATPADSGLCAQVEFRLCIFSPWHRWHFTARIGAISRSKTTDVDGESMRRLDSLAATERVSRATITRGASIPSRVASLKNERNGRMKHRRTEERQVEGNLGDAASAAKCGTKT